MKNIFLNQAQMDKIKELQKALDERILAELDIKGEDIALEKHLALKTELFELINEVESFKWWKKNKGKSHILEEGCDVLHFIFSLAIDNNVDMKEQDSETALFDMDINELFIIMDGMTLDMLIEKDYEQLNFFLKLLSMALYRQGFNAEDLYNAYISKNKVNHERQDNAY